MAGRDALRSYLDRLLQSLDEDVDGEELARRCHLSRYHLDRLLAALTLEPPAALRRRVLLERAAYQLGHSDLPVTELALAAGYDAPSSFSRAFRAAFGHAPRDHRRRLPPSFHLPSPNGIHYHPPAGIGLPGGRRGTDSMDFLDRVLGHDAWLTEALIREAAQLAPATYDAPLDLGVAADPEDGPVTLRGLLDRMVFTKEMWLAAIFGAEPPAEDAPNAPADLLRRWQGAAPRFRAEMARVRDQGRWDDAFIDAICEPPETFTFGGCLAHVVTHSAQRRALALAALRRCGLAQDLEPDPIDWERSLPGRS